MSCRDNGSASAVVLSDFLHATSALPLKDGPPAGEVAMSLLLISLLVRESPSQDEIDGDTGSRNESKRMLPCNRADRGCVASGGQHYLAGNGADFSLVLKLGSITGIFLPAICSVLPSCAGENSRAAPSKREGCFLSHALIAFDPVASFGR